MSFNKDPHNDNNIVNKTLDNNIDKEPTVENKISNNLNKENKQNKSSYIKYFYYFIIYIIITNIINSFIIKDPVFNILSDKDTLNFKFYLTTNNNIYNNILDNTINHKASISINYDMSSFFNDNKDNKLLNITFDNLSLDMIKNYKYENLYLYCIGVIDDVKKNKYSLGIFKNNKNNILYYTKIKLIKYIENFKASSLKSNLINDDIGYTVDYNSGDLVNNNSLINESISKYYYKPEITLYITTSSDKIDKSNIDEIVFLKGDINYNRHNKQFLPPIEFSDFWLMDKELLPLYNNTSNTINIKIDIRYISMTKYKYLKAFDNQLNNNDLNLPLDKDIFVELLKYNSFNYLVILVTVSSLHTLFSFLGFSYDISYHKKLDKLDGLYTKIYFARLFHIIIALIYYTSENVNKFIYFDLFFSLFIEVWKFKKVFKFDRFDIKKFPFIHFSNKIKYDKSDIGSYEEEAVNLFSKVIFVPLALIYLIYRAYYYNNYIILHPYKFVIEYLFFLFNIFGFILMTPQIYINYRIKSVEHMPMKVLAFRFLNTIIDDIFAFAVETPTLYRVSVFKDDIVFVIFIIQMVIYRNNKRTEHILIDNKEINEDKKNN